MEITAPFYWTNGMGTLGLTIPAEAAADCSAGGQDATEAVRYWLDRIHELAAAPLQNLRDHLAELGCWDDLDEVDGDTLRERTLWVACCDIAEEPEVYAID